MDGLMKARFDTRREAELAIEHLVQQEGLAREAISVLPVGSRNSAGTRKAGSDHADGQPASRDRDDAALAGAVEVSVHTPSDKTDSVRRALTEAGGQDLSAD
ncbi:MAG: hypothetical protein JWO26_2884 [Rhodospirillales bacterium]|jgi:hypothetical protein|nr:hypothetical protein [Rhodospirillales bacterium]MDB5383252.1 hypothetical protein [Rhodospirillales bacterium]